ncbi:hypothetical protein NDU88_004835 [Pleurodeles waltl]|uniref:Uncharacterized protein n=1 Tax=Pleurodeles waltl TaxID=8319 RepID=A0AAV7NPN0_PLEWA|nr:hypothetical protein NDU88_004835 [Pleurodeles waltl]
MSARPREPSPGRHFVLQSDRVAARERDPSPSVTHHDGPPRDPGLTRTSKAASFAPLDREIATEVKELRREVGDLGQQVDTLEQAQDAQEEEIDSHRRELLILQERNLELQYQLEDLENRSRRSNIRIKGIPIRAVSGSL